MPTGVRTNLCAPAFVAGLLLLAPLIACAPGMQETVVQDAEIRPVSEQRTNWIGNVAGTFEMDFTEEAFWVGAPVPGDPARNFGRLEAVYQEMGIPVNLENIGEASIGNRGFQTKRLDGNRLSAFLDCGYGVTAEPYADVYDVTLAIQSRVEPGESGGSWVETVVVAWARARNTRGHPIRCDTKQELEKRIIHELRIRADAGRGAPDA